MESCPWTTRSDFIPIKYLEGGSFGSVLKARHTLVDQDYAIKRVLINKTLAHFDGNVDKLYREVKNMEKLSTLNHSNIVQYRHCWLEGENVKDNQLQGEDIIYQLPSSSTQPSPPETNFLFIQMELCQSNLADWLRENSSLELRMDAIPNLIVQLSDALKYIHGQNIVHRWVKAETNPIMIRLSICFVC